MPNTWLTALRSFNYPVTLSDYINSQHYPGFFELVIEGGRQSTLEFENRFRNLAPDNIPAYLEVIFWKMYSQPHRRNNETNRRAKHFRENNISTDHLWVSVQQFLLHPSIPNLRCMRNLLGIRTAVLAVPLTLISFADPVSFPMIDRQVAKWANRNYAAHNINRHHNLTPFTMNTTSLQDNDFTNYINWVYWCREVAEVLINAKIHSNIEWRARDVEMAVFMAQRNHMVLNPLP